MAESLVDWRANHRNRGNSGYEYAGRALIAAAGSKEPAELNWKDVAEAARHFNRNAVSTRHQRMSCLRQLLRLLTETEGAPSLWRAVQKVPKPRPRNVTVTEEEKTRLLSICTRQIELWVLLCSDLAMRSGTAAVIGPEHYNSTKGTLTFTTKHGARMTLPVTERIATLFKEADDQRPGNTPYVAKLQTRGRTIKAHCLRRKWRKLLKAAGIERRITPHDLRRTTAVKVLELSHDLRLVQAVLGHASLGSTLHYLDHNATPVGRATLELAKLPPRTETIQ